MATGIRLSGFTEFIAVLDGMSAGLKRSTGARAYFGTTRSYAGFVNDGARGRPPRQFFQKGERRAAEILGRRGPAQELWDAAVDPDGEGAAEQMAETAARSIRGVIREEDIWLTGALHGSIAFGKTEREMAQRSFSQARRSGRVFRASR